MNESHEAWQEVRKAYDILCSGNPPHSARESNARRALRQALETSSAPLGQKLADELMAMAPTVEAATAEGGAAVLREAAFQLRTMQAALVRIEALGSDGEHSGDRHSACRAIARAALAQAEGRS